MTTAPIEVSPGARPLQALAQREVEERFRRALQHAAGVEGAHCIHELWMRGAMSINVERALEQLWAAAADSIPHWLPMRYIEWLPEVYDVAGRFAGSRKGRANIYLVLLDYRDSRPEPYGTTSECRSTVRRNASISTKRASGRRAVS